MNYYFANTFSGDGIYHSIPQWNKDYQVLVVRGLPQSAVTIFLHDTVADLEIHDIPLEVFLSCVYPDTPDIIIMPSLKRVILNGNNLVSLLKEIAANSKEYHSPLEELDLTLYCNAELLNHYQNSIDELEEKVLFYQQQGLQLLNSLPYPSYQLGELTREMLLLFQSIFPITAENTGQPEKVLISSVTSNGWVSNIEKLTGELKRRYILKSSDTFARTFFKLAESRAHNLNMKCKLFINPLVPDLVEGILFPEEQQLILSENKCHTLTRRPEDIELYFRNEEVSADKDDFEQKLKMAVSSLIRAQSYREEMDEYYWYTLDLDQLFIQRRRLVHKLLALCDGQELWEYFL